MENKSSNLKTRMESVSFMAGKTRKIKSEAADCGDVCHHHLLFGSVSILWSKTSPGAIHHDYAAVGR